MTDDIGRLKKEWEERTLAPALQRSEERSESFETSSGIPVERLHLPRPADYAEKLGFPGEYPFTRGPYPTMYRGRFWTMRQYAGFATAEESNSRYRYLLSQGTTGLSVAFDLPTQIGYDSDHPFAEGEVGKVGVAVDSLEDMQELFDGIDLEKVTTSMTINATASILLAMYVAIAKREGADLRKISGTIQNDILKEYIARGTYIFPPAPSMRLVTDVFGWCGANVPKWNVISISGYHIREAGSTAVQEVAFTMADAIAYVEAAIRAGLDVDRFAPSLSFFFNAHNNLFEEAAKFRAARRIWANIMRDRFRAQNPDSMRLRFHVQTAGATLTAQQIDNNIVRVAIQGLAGVLGGCQSLHTNSRDEALALPTEESARIALRTQQIIAYESGVADTVDPLAGSYFVEHLTDEIERLVWEYLAQIDALGGAVRAIERKFFQTEIAKSAYEYQRSIEQKKRIIVGVNAFEEGAGVAPAILRVDPSVGRRQIERLRALKSRRDGGKVSKALGALRTVAASGENLMPPILTAVESYATLGEISDALRSVWGEFKE